MTQSYFVVLIDIRPPSTDCFFMKIPNKRQLQQIAFNHSSDIDFKDFMNLYKKCKYSFLVIDTTLALDKTQDSFTCQKEFFKKNIKTNHDN